MARIFMGGNEFLDYRADGFTNYAAVTTAFQPGINQTNQAVGFTPNYYGGRGCYFLSNPCGIVYDFTPDFPAGLTEIYMRFHFNGGFGQTGNKYFMRFLDESNNITHAFRITDAGGWGNSAGNGNYQLQAWRGDDAINYANTAALNSGRGFNNTPDWLIEFHIKVAGSGGIVEWQVDGVNSGGTFSGNTLGPLGQTAIRKFVLMYTQGPSGGNVNYLLVDDLVINDTSGLVNNSWPGDGRIIPFSPNGPGGTTQLTNSYGTSTNNFNFVNRINYQGLVNTNFNPSYKAYGLQGFGSVLHHVGTSTPNQKDLYSIPKVPIEFTQVKSLSTTAYATRHSTTITKAKLLYQPPAQAEIANPAAGLPLSLDTNGYIRNMIDINPNTGLPFTIAELNGMQIGIQFIP